MNRRIQLLKNVMCLVCLIFAIRLLYLQVYKHDFFLQKSTQQMKRIIKVFAHRGHIFDRHNRPLALTQTTYSVFALPHNIENKWVYSKRVSDVFKEPAKPLRDQLYNTSSPFLWVKRQVGTNDYASLKALNLQGIGFIKTEKRVYPQGALAAQVLGFVGIDNQGLGGLEYKYDHMLKGSAGKIVLERDPRGFQLISGSRKTIPNYDGQHIITTLDSRLQYYAEKYLKEGIQKNEAKKGQVIIMNPKNGDILAMASYPTFNANIWQKAPASNRKIPSVVDVYEPGSVFKVITLAAVLEEELVSTATVFTVPETLRVYDRTIHEAHARDKGDTDQKTVSEIIEQSLNVGVAMLSDLLDKTQYYTYLKEFGFGKETGIELPGESKGLLRDPSAWSGVDKSMISFGQGVAVTSIQMASAIGCIANGGVYVKPRIVDYFSDHTFETRKSVPITQTHRVIREETAHQIKQVMHKVVQQGTGMIAHIPGITIAGKTGTAQKAREDGKGYADGEYIASFAGFFPVEDPEVLILVLVDTPTHSIWGSSVAGPIFKQLAQVAIDRLGILLDERYLSLSK